MIYLSPADPTRVEHRTRDLIDTQLYFVDQHYSSFVTSRLVTDRNGTVPALSSETLPARETPPDVYGENHMPLWA